MTKIKKSKMKSTQYIKIVSRVRGIMTESEVEKLYNDEVSMGSINTSRTPNYSYNEYKRNLEDNGVRIIND